MDSRLGQVRPLYSLPTGAPAAGGRAVVVGLRVAHPPASGASEPGTRPRGPREGRLLPEE